MQDESFGNSALSDLRELGMQLVLDNFATGYSSLSYIYKYTLDSINIEPLPHLYHQKPRI